MMAPVSQPITEDLDVYIVGGAVRDELLGRQAGDRDWVVVGSSPDEMVRRGFVPVGADFPVFLHPQTKEEYALARTERKSGRGYKGFTFYAGSDVTLADDLKRRDLTVNAMAKTQDGVLVDPLGGLQDLQSKVLRHVGPAFEEDPVRILRLARFAARFFEFQVASETYALCRRMVELGEADALVPERVWQEISRGLMSERPSRMFEVLRTTGALPVVLPGLVYDDGLGRHLDAAAQSRHKSLPGMYALMMHLTLNRADLAVRLRATSECAAWADLLPSLVEHCPILMDLGLADWSQQALQLFERADAIRRPERFLSLLDIANHLIACPHRELAQALSAARGIDAGAIARSIEPPSALAIAAAVRRARLEAVERR